MTESRERVAWRIIPGFWPRRHLAAAVGSWWRPPWLKHVDSVSFCNAPCFSVLASFSKWSAAQVDSTVCVWCTRVQSPSCIVHSGACVWLWSEVGCTLLFWRQSIRGEALCWWNMEGWSVQATSKTKEVGWWASEVLPLQHTSISSALLVCAGIACMQQVLHVCVTAHC